LFLVLIQVSQEMSFFGIATQTLVVVVEFFLARNHWTFYFAFEIVAVKPFLEALFVVFMQVPALVTHFYKNYLRFNLEMKFWSSFKDSFIKAFSGMNDSVSNMVLKILDKWSDSVIWCSIASKRLLESMLYWV